MRLMTEGSWNQCPEARSEGLFTEYVGDELVIFDAATNEAHALKPLAAAVFTAADGATSVGELAAVASSRLGYRVPVSDIERAVEELGRTGLLEGADLAVGLSRRHLLRVGGATAAGVLISSALVPAMAAASAPPCAPTSAGSLTCGFSELAIVVQDNTNQNLYYAMKLSASSTTAVCGAFTYCNGISVTGYAGQKFQTTCPKGMNLTQGASGIAADIPTGYTLVAWYFHNGTPSNCLTCKNGVAMGCAGPITDTASGVGQSGCIQIDACKAAGC
jgi:hypothetical protein